jgi:hypothetical protein
MTQGPLELSAADLREFAAAGQSLGNIAGTEGSNITDLFQTVQKWLELFEQFSGSVDRFGATISRLRSQDGLGPPDQGGSFFPQGQVIDAGVYRPPPPPPPPPPTQQEAPDAPMESQPDTKQFEALELYQLALGNLAKLAESMPDLKVADALALARSNKDLVLDAINTELEKKLNAGD